jgi:D-threo-aldose 1-dehydrogenase
MVADPGCMAMDPTRRTRIGRTRVEVTALGCGGAPLGNLFSAVTDAAAEETLSAAWEAGVRYFDTAPYYGYGLSEQRLGRFLSGVERGAYVLSTKVGRLLERRSGGDGSEEGYVDALPFQPVFDYSYDAAKRSLEESLKRLGCGRIDIVLIHDIGVLTHGEAHAMVLASAMAGAYRALDELRASGDIGAVGLGVNEWQVCLDAIERGDFDCFLLAGRYTLLDQSALERLLPACEARGISVIAGGAYNSGILAREPGVGSSYDYRSAEEGIVRRARRIAEICRRHRVPLQAAALQFALHHPAVASVIPGQRSREEVAGNVEFFRHAVPVALWRELAAARLLDPRAPLDGA